MAWEYGYRDFRSDKISANRKNKIAKKEMDPPKKKRKHCAV
jgi:hypothetical protein